MASSPERHRPAGAGDPPFPTAQKKGLATPPPFGFTFDRGRSCNDGRSVKLPVEFSRRWLYNNPLS